MNPIQRAWLKVLQPLQYLINERLANRQGLFGRIGKFFLIGPREYGVHPINKMLIFLNRRWLFASAILLHRYSFFKTLTHNGYHMMRIFKHGTLLGPLAVFIGLLRFVYYNDQTKGYTADRLPYLERRIGGKIALPLNSLNQRTSAHFIEINAIYGAEMVKRYHKVHQSIIEERNKASDEQKKTRYADPSYKYTPLKPVSLAALNLENF